MDSLELKNVKMKLALWGVTSSGANSDIYQEAMQKVPYGAKSVLKKAHEMLLERQQNRKVSADAQENVQVGTKENPVIIEEKCKGCKKTFFIVTGIVATIIIFDKFIKKYRNV